MARTSPRVTLLSVLPAHASAVTSLAFAPDGHTLASGDDASVIYLWDLYRPSQVRPPAPLLGHTGGVNSLAYGAVDEGLYSASQDGTVRSWNTDLTVVAHWVCRTGPLLLDRGEWGQYFTSVAYRRPCP